jgi:hypothetical protein
MFHFIEKSLSTGNTREFERPLFPADTKALLVHFIECARALNDTAFVRKRDQTKISIHMANDGRITDRGSLPADDEIAAFLHRLRPIYLNNEPTNFNRVANVASAHFNDPSITRLIRECKRHDDGRASREVFEIAAGGMVINSQEFLDHYLNALEYHRDPDRRQHIDRVAEHFPLDAQKPFVVLLLVMRLNAINKLASFLLTCFDREDGRTLTLEMT